MRRWLWAAVLLGTLLSLAVSYGVATRSIGIGLAEGRWVYEYVRPFRARSIEIALLVGALSATLLSVPQVVSGFRTDWASIAAWSLFALALQGQLRWLGPFPLEHLFASDVANSFYTVAVRHDAATILADFERLRPTWPLHAQSNMPGKVLVVNALLHVAERLDGLVWLVVVLSNLGGILLYLLVRDLFADRRVALYSFVLYLFVPAKLFFFPLLNTLTPTAVLLCTWLLVRWLTTARATYAAALGVALYGLVLYEPLPLVMGLLFVALVARAVRVGGVGLRTLLRGGALGVATFAATYAAVLLWLGFDLLAALRVLTAEAVAFNAAAARPYAVWVRQNLLDFLFGVGVCQVVVFWAGLADGLASGRDRWTHPATTLCAGLLAVLLAVNLMGVNRGEVTRLWIFLACFAQVPAAFVCARLGNRVAIALVLATTLLQDAIGVSMIAFVDPG